MYATSLTLHLDFSSFETRGDILCSYFCGSFFSVARQVSPSRWMLFFQWISWLMQCPFRLWMALQNSRVPFQFLFDNATDLMELDDNANGPRQLGLASWGFYTTMARVNKVVAGAVGVVRSWRMKTTYGYIHTPVIKLSKIPVDFKQSLNLRLSFTCVHCYIWTIKIISRPILSSGRNLLWLDIS